MPTSLYKPSTGCRLEYQAPDLTTVNSTLNYAGHTVTAEVLHVTGTEKPRIELTTFEPSVASQLIGVNYYPMITMVHKAEDIQGGGGAGSGSNSGNAASLLRPGGSSGLDSLFLLCMWLVLWLWW